MTEENKCTQLDRSELQVICDGQLEVLCPKCGFYCNGKCNNPNRVDGGCPFEGKLLPVENVKENADGGNSGDAAKT